MDSLTSAPFVHSGARTRRIMLDAAIALLPAAAGAVWYCGLPALSVLFFSAAGCALTEWGLTLLHRASWRDGSAAVTGLLLALLLPARCPWWAAMLGGCAAMLSKALSGGLGRNVWNPAALARTLLLAFPSLRPAPLRSVQGRFLLGYTGGSLGEISSLLLLAGAGYLLLRRLLPALITAPALTAAFLTGLCLPRCDALAVAVWGGTILTAAFLAADPVTSPMTPGLRGLYGASCGVCCTLCAYFFLGAAGSCAALLCLNLIFRILERLAGPA